MTKLLIFGVTGDLAKRKLLPALKQVVSSGSFQEFEIIGITRRAIDLSELVDKSLIKKMSLYQMDIADLTDYKKLKKHLKLDKDSSIVIYLAVPPMVAASITKHLGQAKLNGPKTKILFEKPFGMDIDSAKAMMSEVKQYFEENQMYMIDHYLAKEMTQNIVAFRGSNSIFRQVWSNRSIEKIDIIASEIVGLEGRGNFYDPVGALRDLVQGHLMQLLALILMDMPSRIVWSNLPALRLEALRHIETVKPREVVRGQYIGYRNEVYNPNSQTETFVMVNVRSNSALWEGVPIRLITGKALKKKVTCIDIYFRANDISQTNRLRFNIQPNEGVEIDLYSKKPGYERELEMQKLAFKYPDDLSLPEAYEQVLIDALRSEKSLFTTSEEIIESWRILQPTIESWQNKQGELYRYARGTSYKEILGQ